MTPGRRLALAALVPVLLTGAVYGAVGRFGFVDLDDPYYVYANQHLTHDHGPAALRYAFTTFSGGNWHPLVWLSFFTDARLFGLRPGPMHVENAVLHGASAVLVLLLLARASGSVGRSTVCAALFAVHPAHVESVAWISERKDVLSTAWLLAAAYAYVRHATPPPSRRLTQVPAGPLNVPRRASASLASSRHAARDLHTASREDASDASATPAHATAAGGPRLGYAHDPGPRASPLWYAAMIACYALSLSAKSMGVTLPAVLLLLDGWPLGRLRGRVGRRVLEKVPLLVMAAAAAAVAGIAQQSVGATRAIDTTIGERVANAAVSYALYGFGLVWPTGLAAYYPFRPVAPEAAGAAIGLLAFVTVVAVRVRHRRPYVLVGWLWFAGALLPVSGLVQIGAQARADRYTYFPSIGLSVAVVWTVADAVATVAWAGPAIATAAVASLAVAGRRQAGYWRDDLALFTRAEAVTTDNTMADDHLGRAAIARGDFATAAAYLNRAIEADPSSAVAYADLGRCAALTGQHDRAVEVLAHAVELAPGWPSFRVGLATELEATGQHAAAVAQCRRAIELDPESSTARDQWAHLTGRR